MPTTFLHTHHTLTTQLIERYHREAAIARALKALRQSARRGRGA